MKKKSKIGSILRDLRKFTRKASFSDALKFSKYSMMKFLRGYLVKRNGPHDYHTCTVVCTMLKSIKCWLYAFFTPDAETVWK